MEEIKIQKEKVTDQFMEIGHKDQRFASSILYSEIIDSTITLIGKGGSLTLIDSIFKNCTINGKKAYGYFLNSASWLNCKFEGRFSDCVFGYGVNLQTKEDILTKIEYSDFSNANLDIVAFRGGLEYSTCKWPSFPHVLVISDELPSNIKKLSLPPELISFVKISSRRKSQDAAVAYDLTRFDKDLERIYSVTFNVPGFHFFGDSTPSISSEEYIEASKAYYANHKVLYARYSLWSFISQSVSIISIDKNHDAVTLNLKSSSSPHVPVPEKFSIRLKGVSKLDLADSEFLTESKNKKSYRIMGAKISDDYESVKLKGHRKNLGQIELAYEKVEFLDQVGSVIDIEALNKWSIA